MRSRSSGVEVQSRRGRRRRARLLAVHRLIAVGILQLFVDIGRQGHGARAGKDVLERPLIGEADDALARLGDGDHFEGELVVDGELCPGAALPAGAHEHLPLVEVEALQKQHLGGAAVLGAGIEAGGSTRVRLRTSTSPAFR